MIAVGAAFVLYWLLQFGLHVEPVEAAAVTGVLFVMAGLLLREVR